MLFARRVETRPSCSEDAEREECSDTKCQRKGDLDGGFARGGRTKKVSVSWGVIVQHVQVHFEVWGPKRRFWRVWEEDFTCALRRCAGDYAEASIARLGDSAAFA